MTTVDKSAWSDPNYNGKTISLVSDDDNGKEYVFRWPNNGNLSRYTKESLTGNVAKGSRNLVLELLLFPARDVLLPLFEDLPGLPIALANEVNKKIGLTAEFSEKN
jgi:hypothetical protein